jgi:hypothetical protein
MAPIRRRALRARVQLALYGMGMGVWTYDAVQLALAFRV